MATQISDQLFVNAVHELVAENPEFVYQRQPRPANRELLGCLYINDAGEGSCLVGQALVRAGVPAAEIRPYDEAVWLVSACAVLPNFGVSAAAAEWAEVVQEAQDSGDQWGAALKSAEDELPARFRTVNA